MSARLSGLLGLVVFGLLAGAAPAAERDADRFTIEYVAPTRVEHASLARQLQDHEVLEQLKAFLGPFRLPAPLKLKLESCGSANAWYGDRVITVCYEYLGALVREASAEPPAPGVSRADAVVGPTLEVFLHEMAHAMFELLRIPVLGREEDAADQLAAYLLLNLSRDEARRAVIGTASMYLREARAFKAAELTQFAGPHALPAQRYYNLLCLAYGKDPELFAEAVTEKLLPRERAEDCAGEFKQVAFAFHTLLGPHLDRERIQAMRSRRWLDFDTAGRANGAPARSKTN
jgi:hypothetical protein